MRRRKPKVVWLPTTNTFSVDSANSSCWSFASVSITGADALTGGAGGKIEVPVVMDGTASDPLGATSSLADIENSGYRLRRIVGKVYCFMGQTLTATINEDIWGVSAGFIIRRVDPATGGSNAVAASAAAGFDQIDPANIDNSMDPWIWKRDWLLSNYTVDNSAVPVPVDGRFASVWAHAAGGANYGRLYPGGNAEGPHVDQKTARIVGPEERLFLDVSATPIISGSNSSLIIIYTLRVLASMRTSVGNRRNASR